MKNLDQVIEAARIHYENVKADINNASTRIEHIRLTTLAQEAANLLTDIQNLRSDAATEFDTTD